MVTVVGKTNSVCCHNHTLFLPVGTTEFDVSPCNTSNCLESEDVKECKHKKIKSVHEWWWWWTAVNGSCGDSTDEDTVFVGSQTHINATEVSLIMINVMRYKQPFILATMNC